MSEDDVEKKPEPEGQWWTNAFWQTLVGCVGPFNAYNMVFSPDRFAEYEWWKNLMLVGGSWLMTGLIFSGLTIAWVGGYKKQPDWQKRGEDAAWRWSKLGLWLAAIGVGIIAAIWLYGKLSDFSDSIPPGTKLIAFLLFMILVALWGIAEKLNKRQ